MAGATANPPSDAWAVIFFLFLCLFIFERHRLAEPRLVA